MSKMYAVHWSELNDLGKGNVAHTLAELMLPTRRDIPVEGWPGKFRAYFYLDAEYHLYPRTFGMKVTMTIEGEGQAITLEQLREYLLKY